MKINTVNVVMFCVGAILVYSGIKSYDPRDVIKWGLGGKKPKQMMGTNGGDWEDNLGDNKENPDPGQRYPGDQGLPSENGPTTSA